MNLPVAILAGGLATRLGPLTASLPKSLIEVAGKPFVVHQLELLERQGFRDVVLLLGRFGDMVQRELGDGSRIGVRLRYSFDGPRQLGTGGSIRQALPKLGEAFLVLYGDSYLNCDYQAVQRAFLESGKSGLMTVFLNDGLFDRSNVLFENGVIGRYDKQATSGVRHIDYGLGAFRANVFESRPDGAFDLATVYQELLAAGDLAGYEVRERFYEIGSPAGLEETRAHLATLKGIAS